MSEWMSQIGEAGGKARAESLTPEQRSESARKAVRARWARKAQQNGTAPKSTALAKSGIPSVQNGPTPKVAKKKGQVRA